MATRCVNSMAERGHDINLTDTAIAAVTRSPPIAQVGRAFDAVGHEHVGIFTNSFVYHYSNDLGKQVVRQTIWSARDACLQSSTEGLGAIPV